MRLFRLIFNNRSLWYKLTLLSLLPVVIVTAVIAFQVMGAVETAMVKEAKNEADGLTELTRLSMSNAFLIYNKTLLDNFVDALGRTQFVKYALVVDSGDKRILAHNDHSLDGKLISDVSDIAGDLLEVEDHYPNERVAAHDLYLRSAPIIIDDKQYASLHIGFSFEEVHVQMASVKRSILLVALLAVFVGVSLSLFAAKIMSTPIHGLARQAERAGSGDFDQSLIYKSKDEIGQLADAFNRMLADIRVKHRQLTAINTIADAVYRSLDTKTVARNAVNAMMTYGQYPGVAVFMINDRRKQLELVCDQGFDQETLKKASVLPLEGSLTGIAVRSKEVVSSMDISTDERLVPDVRKALMAGNLHSVLSVPLLAQDRVLGAMNLIYKTKYVLSDFEKETLMSIGKTIGLAMANARQMARIRREIEERIEAENSLRESENKYRSLVERANDGIVIIQDGLIRFANPSAVALSGQGPEDFIGQPFAAYLHPTEKNKIKEMYERRMTGDTPPSIYETIFVRKDGKPVYAEVNAGRITYQDRPADLVLIRDISERKRAQEALKQAFDQLEVKVSERTAELAVAKERAEESDRLKSAFLASMSHELRTPLNSIIGFTGIILQRLVGPLNDEQHKQLKIVQDSANHLLSLINDVLDLSKIEAGQLNVASEAFDMPAAINKVVRTVTPMARKKGLQISIHISSTVGIIISDKIRVEQILLNLLNNAIKFTPRGQVILICEANAHWITTTVKDTGIGIAPTDMDKLFRAFHQIETGLSRRFDGTGLGLSICKKLVALLGGKIDAHSEGLGQGAAFTFTLPAGERYL